MCFQGVRLPFYQKSYTSLQGVLSNYYFFRTLLSGFFCILCSLLVKNSESINLSQYIQSSTSHDHKFGNIVEKTYYAKFWQILKELTKYNWRCSSVDTPMKLASCMFKCSILSKQQILDSCCCFLTFTCDLKIGYVNYADILTLFGGKQNQVSTHVTVI